MKLLIQLAIKNVMRYKRRTVLTFLILSIGVALFIIMQGLMEGYKAESLESTINFETGHFKLRSAQFDPDSPYSISNFIKNGEAVKSVLKTRGYILAFTERISFQGEIDNNVNSTPCIVNGINPETDPLVFSLSNYVSAGGFLNTGDVGMAMIGSRLAKEMELGENDIFYITFRNGQGMIDSIQLQVKSLLLTPDPMVNSAGIYITLSDAQKVLNIDTVSEISVRVDYSDKYLEYEADLLPILPDNQIWNYNKLSEMILAISSTKKDASSMFIFFIMIIAIVGIINTMLMSVFEKTREIGTLKALGMKDRDVHRLFMIEGSILGLLGGLAGVLFGVLGNWYLVAVGMDIGGLIGDQFVDMVATYRMQNVIHSLWDIKTIFSAFFLCVFFSVLASFYPAKKATKMQPVECLRTVQ